MAHRYSVSVNNGRLDAIETVIGGTALLRMLTGTAPANCAAANTGGTIFEFALPADYMAAAGSGIKAKAGTWSGTAIASGTVGYYRIYDQPGTTCHIQGNVASPTGGELNLDNNIVNTGQVVTISTYSITAANT